MNDNHLLYRPIGPQERGLIEASGWQSFPAGAPDGRWMFFLHDREIARRIAAGWHQRVSGAGYVAMADVTTDALLDLVHVLTRNPWQMATDPLIPELICNPRTLNRQLRGPIQVIDAFTFNTPADGS